MRRNERDKWKHIHRLVRQWYNRDSVVAKEENRVVYEHKAYGVRWDAKHGLRNLPDGGPLPR